MFADLKFITCTCGLPKASMESLNQSNDLESQFKDIPKWDLNFLPRHPVVTSRALQRQNMKKPEYYL